MFSPYRHLPALALAVGAGIAAPACASPLYQSRGVYSQRSSAGPTTTAAAKGSRAAGTTPATDVTFSYTRSGEYRDADDGYRREDGNRDAYRRTFRQGFEAGYSEGFNQFARSFPRATPYPRGTRPRISVSLAAQNGYRDGLEAGRR